MKKKRPFVPVGNTNRDKRVRQPRGRWLHLLSRLVTPGTKGHPLLSRTGVPGWETGTTAVSQPGQINVFVVVRVFLQITLVFVNENIILLFWKVKYVYLLTIFNTGT